MYIFENSSSCHWWWGPLKYDFDVLSPAKNFHWKGFSLDKPKSTVIAVTSQVGWSFSSFRIEEQKYSLKAFFSNLFNLSFVERSSGCSKWVLFFDTMFISIVNKGVFTFCSWLCLDRILYQQTFLVTWQSFLFFRSFYIWN